MAVTNPEIERPALRYFGGKFRLAPWIIKNFPPHLTYVEPYGGGGSVLLRKKPSYHEVYNDLDGEVVNFFRVLRERTDEFIKAIELTPYAREEQVYSFIPADDEFERARRLYVRAWQSHGGGRTQWRTGWRYEKNDTRGSKMTDDWNKIDYLFAIAKRLKTVQIENDDAVSVIKRFDDSRTLFYLDPPYLPTTRSMRWRKKAYTFELTEQDHIALAELLNGIEGMVILSGHPSDLYDELYAGWRKVSKSTTTDFQSRTIECLWISPKADESLPQLTLL